MRGLLAILPVAPLTLFLFIRLGLYRAFIHYAVMRLVAVILLASALSGLALFLTMGALDVPHSGSIAVIYTILTLLCIGASRFGLRQLLVTHKYQSKKQAVIYGAGASGRQLLQKLRQGSAYQPIAFVDDAESARGTIVSGLRVYDPAELGPLMQSSGVEAVLLALPSASKARRSEILKTLAALVVHVRSIPDRDDLRSGKARIDQLRDIGIEDLLSHDPIVPVDRISGNICGKVVMVTGAGGAIGTSLCRQILCQAPRHLILYEPSEDALHAAEQQLIDYASTHGIAAQITAVLGSAQMAHRVESSLRLFKVQSLYHVVAGQNPNEVGRTTVEDIRNTVFGTKTVAKAAVAVGVNTLVLISSDKAMQPTNVMTASRRMAEMICQSLAQSLTCAGTKIAIVRIGSLVGRSGSIVPLLSRQIVAGGLIRLPHPEMTRHFMSQCDASQLVLQVGAIEKTGQIFVLNMGAPVRIAELAERMVRLRGMKPVLLPARRSVKKRRGQIRPNHIHQDQIGMIHNELRPGEQLCDRPLLGRNPRATAHPRIMATAEIFQTAQDMAVTLRQLEMACDRNDIGHISVLLAGAQTGYQPEHDSVEHFRRHENDAAATMAPKVATRQLARETATGGGFAMT